MTDECGKTIPMLVYANKQDLEGAMDIPTLCQDLDLNDTTANMENAIIHVQGCSCKLQDDGLKEGFEWLTDKIVSMNLAKNRE